MKLDRHLQLAILTALQDIYPDALLVQDLPGYSPDRHFMGNMLYLKEHNLISGGDIREPGQCRSMIDAEITREGLDFLEDDGGLSAILNQHIIRLERADIITLLLDNHGVAGGEEQQCKLTRERLERIPIDTLKNFVKRVVGNVALESPELLQQLIENSQTGKG